MKKTLLVIVCFVLLVAGGFVLYKIKTSPKQSIPSQSNQNVTSTTDNFYYQIKLKDGRQFVSIVNNYSDGRIEMYAPFILVDDKLQLFSEYVDSQLRKENNGGIRQSNEGTANVFLEPSDIVEKVRLENDSATVNSINDFFAKRRQQNPNPLN